VAVARVGPEVFAGRGDEVARDRGAGHGRALLAALLDGAGPAWLLTDVRAGAAMRFYARDAGAVP
jgi:hypothetical protein